MSHRAACRYRRVALLCLSWLCGGAAAAAADDAKGDLFLPFAEQSRETLLGERAARGREMGWVALGTPRAARRIGMRHGKLDLSPLADQFLRYLQDNGLPLQEQRDAKGRGPIGVTAAFNVSEDLPAIGFHIGDRPIEPLGAFYSPEKGFRCAVVWPIDPFTLRLEGGEDSEFGYFGIAGVQWIHPTLPIAAGVGVPMNLRDADGDIGVIFQFRMKLD
ncbi:MAG: hypothetical protein ACRERC_12630 [Candidatus Binatia bacterium]